MPAARLRILFAVLAVMSVSPATAGAADPLESHQWGLSGTNAIGAAAAWQHTRGAGVVVAVLDSGVQLDHPDLAANLWTNPREVPANAIDDDHNGYVDDVHGTFIGALGEPRDDNGHGTHVAGIIAAANNGIGGSGVAPEAQIMAVKVLDARNIGAQEVLARGLRYAIANGADIINASVNGQQSSPELEAAIAEADSAGISVVVSAGNAATNIDVHPSFPASLPAANVITVTATQSDGEHWHQGNYGRRSVDLAAPGGAILSTLPGSTWGRRSGTSMAAPFVAGALALLTSAHPELPAARLREAVVAGAKRRRSLRRFVGAGQLDLIGALRVAAAAASASRSTAPGG
ncbi:MAG TPA: S8 family peptidase [Solirubrobacteraceae bacterium]|nr:S8 family peptidase [Solirubrobacteraceae bacterium]